MRKTMQVLLSLLLLALVATGLAGWMLWSMHNTLSSIEGEAFNGAKYEAKGLIYTLQVLHILKEELMAYNCTPGMLKEDKPDSYIYYMANLYYGVQNAQNMKRYIEISYLASGMEPPYPLMDSLERIHVYMGTLHNHIQSTALSNATKPIDCSILPDEGTINELIDSLNGILGYESPGGISGDFIARLHEASKKLIPP